MTVFTPIDQATRDEIRRELGANLAVEAGAGTGKTTVLVDRIVEILRTGHAGIDQLAVITFTEKAAAELSGRIRERLEEAARGSDLPDQRERVEAAIRGLHRARIETIHAFAGALLRERPVEAKIDPGFEVLDRLGADLSFEEAFGEWRAKIFDECPAPLWRALNRGITLDLLRDLARALHQHRDLFPLDGSEPAPCDTAAFLAALDAGAAELERLLADCRDESDRGRAQITAALDLRDRLRAAGDDSDRIERLLLLAPSLAHSGGNNKNWRDAASNARQKEICRSLRDRLEGVRRELRAEALTGLIPLLGEFARDYAERRRRAGKAEFDDLLIWARDLLRDNLAVRRYFQSRFRCLLVDEFQDTDPLQVEIVLYLTSDGQEQTDARELRPAAGKLFVVGDPKQSIYRFRRADITIYDWVTTDVLGEGRRHIVQNFRSVAPVIAWVNRAFAEIISHEPGIQPAYVPLEPAMPDPGHPAVLLLPGDGAATTADAIREQEAELLAATVAAAVREERWLVRDGSGERPASWRNVAILLPRRTGLERYGEALARRGIPYRHEGGRAFFERQEVRELIACLRAIDDPTDRLSLVAALRSGAFGCSDEEILRYVAAGGALDYRSVAIADHPDVSEALATLAALHESRRQLPLVELVGRVLDETRLVEFALTLPQGEQAAGNLLKVVEQARAFSAAHGGGLRAFVRWLATSSAGRSDEEDAAVAEAGDDVVRLLTIHAAKGLEFPIVALANLHGERPDRSPVRAIPDRDGRRLHLRVSAGGASFETPGYEAMKELEARHEAAQDDRLLYVAATRARDYLVLPLVPPITKVSGPLKRLYACLYDPSGEPRQDDSGAVRVVDGRTWAHSPNGASAEPWSGEADIKTALAERDAWWHARQRLIERASQGAPLTTASSGADPDESPTPESDDDGWRGGTERAIAIGAALHATMELIDLGTGRDIDAVARAEAERLSTPELAAEVARLARACRESRAVRRALRAKRYVREVSFSLGLPGDGLLQGRVDLIFQEPDGLVIVDYKTDRRAVTADAARVAAYRDQAALYAYAIGRSTGLPVREVVFVLPRLGIEPAIAVDERLLDRGARLALSRGTFGREETGDAGDGAGEIEVA